MTPDELLDKVTTFYLESGDFNGLPVRDISDGNTDSETQECLTELVLNGMVAIVFGDCHPNPHIRALPENNSPDRQVELLKTSPLIEHACVYPLPKHLEKTVDRSKYADEPYTLALALGGTQLSHRAFDMMILETYRNDPRYHYDCDDIQGHISITDEHYQTGSTPESDQILLKHFGFAYTDSFEKYVAVFLWDLFKLSPEHQRLWHIREFKGNTRLHPDFYRSAILGAWPANISIYAAFVEELRIINEMTSAMGRPPLFRETFSQRPKEFASLLRPTTYALNSFVHLLDKMMSDNINKAFFQDDVPDHEDKIRSDGGIETTSIGTIRMLENWMSIKFRSADTSPITEAVNTFRDVRKRRQKPAHSVNNDTFDQNIIQEQRDLMERAYSAIRLLRLLFSNHPAAKAVHVPEPLYKGHIWTI